MSTDNKFKISIVSFTDPRATALEEERENYIRDKHTELIKFLQEKGFEVIDTLNIGVISTLPELNSCIKYLRENLPEALLIGCWHWTEPYLVVRLVTELNLPVLLYTEDDPSWAGVTCVSAVGASLWENAPNSHALSHKRIIGDKEEIVHWIRGVAVAEKLKHDNLLLWGGTYCLKMEHLQDDIPYLKSFLIGDILTEGEYIIIKRAAEILNSSPTRINKFIKWLTNNNCEIIYDRKMLTNKVLRKQVAIYLAVKDRLNELEKEKINAVSIRCQPEISEVYGIDACFVPAFLPYPEDAEGEKEIIPTVCEGDIKGLLSALILYRLNPTIPPLFGDLKYISSEYIIISNCGASSIYYAANSNKAHVALKNVVIAPQVQGKSGGAVGYYGKAAEVTVCRLIRKAGSHIMQIGVSEILNVTNEIMKNIKWGITWPHVVIKINLDKKLIMDNVGSNHLCATIGNYEKELEYFCNEKGIKIEKIV